jgi:uncharacterized protein DUF4136
MTRSVRVAIALNLVLAGATPMVAQTPKYHVTVTTDSKADFSKFKTYTWENGWQAYDKTVHANIRASVDRQLAAVGLEKRESGPADLLVTYASLRRIDVDLKAKPSKDGTRPQYDVGTLVVLLLDPGTRNELFRGRVDKPIVLEPEKVQPVVDGAVTEMFAKYPTRLQK